MSGHVAKGKIMAYDNTEGAPSRPRLRVSPTTEGVGQAEWRGNITPAIRLVKRHRGSYAAKGYWRVIDKYDEELMRIAFARLEKDEKRTFLHWSKSRKIKRPKPSLAEEAGPAHSWPVTLLRRWADFAEPECRFFPGMTEGRPTKCRYNFKNMAVARAMLLLTQGLPPDGKDLATHICGNGHLSCVNPTHLRWGSSSDNAQDAVLHNGPREFIAGMDRDVVEAVRDERKLNRVIAWEYGLPAAVVEAIRSGEMWPEQKL